MMAGADQSDSPTSVVTLTRQVNGTQRKPARTTTSGARKSSPRRTTARQGTLATMTRSDLLHLAQERDVPGRSSMSKKQLVTALEKKQ